jgi:ABC-type sugar transport system substrate-binding protein
MVAMLILSIGAIMASASVIRIGYTVNDFNDKWVSYVLDEVRKWDEQHPDVEVTLGNGKSDVSTQMALVEDWITQNYDAICVKPVDADAALALVEQCKKAGIPYVAVQQPIKNADVIVGPDAVKTGETEMEAAIKMLPNGKGRVVYLSGEPGTLISSQREEGSMNALKKYPDVELVGSEIGNWLRDQAMKIVENWIQSGLEFDVVVAACDEMAIGAYLALDDAGIAEGKIIGGIDGTPDGLQMVVERKMSFTMYEDPSIISVQSLIRAVDLVNKKPVENYFYEPNLVFPEDAKEYLAKSGN